MSVNTITPITGSSNICVGQPTTLSDATSGGSWTSQTPTIASIGSTGIVTGIAGGLSTVISYTLSSGCFTTKTVNVNSLATISGSTTACVGQSTALTDAIPGGTWTSSNALIATVGSVYGDVTGVSAGTVIISYTLASGCNAAQTMTVYPLSPITGPSSVCNGLSITLSDATPGGTWTSSSPTMATVGATTGIVTGAAAGFTPTITYTLGTGCKATMVVTVNALTAISGGASICQAQPITLTNPNAGGTWSSADLAIATIGTSGIITGVSAGTTTISYVLPTGCTSTRIQRVFASQDPTGASSICTGNTTTLADAITPGNWTSNNIAVATVGSLTGIVTGIAAGTAAITYKVLASGCRTAFIMTVKNSSGVITGSASLCAGATTTYTDASPSGLWGSDNTAVATVGSVSGIVTGIANGTATITYSTGCGTDATKVITVANSAITGTLALCAGSSTTLSNAAIGGFWTSSNTSIATIGTGTGLVSAVSAGTSIISYNNGSCTATVVFAVSDVPAAISGTPSICPGSSTSLSNTVPNGIWSSSDIAVATVGSINGVLTGVSTGTATITYSTGCGTAATITATISNASPITGAGSICVGATATLSNTGGGTWTSSNTSIATINSTSGLVTGIASGTTTISYILGTGCISTAVETINGVPLTISGSSVVCISSTIALTNATSGGTWTSSAAGNATILLE